MGPSIVQPAVQTENRPARWISPGLTNEKRELRVLTNERRVLRMLTNEKRELRVLNNER